MQKGEAKKQSQNLIDADDRKGVGEEEEDKGGINGVGRRLDLGRGTHNTIYR